MVLIGRVSYPLYLWHWPLLAFATAAFPGELPALTRTALVLAGFLLAVGTWRWIESPLHGQRIALPGRLVGAILVVSVAVATLLVQVAEVTRTAPPRNDPGAVAKLDRPANILHCHNSYDSPAQLPNEAECALGGKQTPKIALWGDSHALAFQPFATAMAVREGRTAVAYSRDACAPAIGYDNGQSSLLAERCKNFNAAAIRRAVTMDTVVLASRWPNPGDREFAADLTATVVRLASHVRRVFIIGPTPVLRANAPYCVRRDLLHDCEVSRVDFIAQSASIRALLMSLETTHPNVTYVEPLDFFCDASVCPGSRDGMTLYWDAHHVSSTAAAAFGKAYLAHEADTDL
jgi:hypothetical protein